MIRNFFAYHGIWACHQRDNHWVTGVTYTDGGGNSRRGPCESLSDDRMARIEAP